VHYGTCENEKIGGDAEAAAREGGDEAANAQTGAEVRALLPAIFKISPHEVPSPKPVVHSLQTVAMCDLSGPQSTNYVALALQLQFPNIPACNLRRE
jgi:hypothetical protein